MSAIQQDIAAREYEVSWQSQTPVDGLAPAWQAPNRAHGFRTYFTEQGIRVIPRTDAAPSWEWGLALAGYGRGSDAWTVPASVPAAAAARVEYQRTDVAEWYLNDPRGLEQGFVLRASPEDAARRRGVATLRGRTAVPGQQRGAPDGSLVHLDLALSGTLRPIVAADGQSIDFALPGGDRVLRYGALVVEDATGRALPAWLEGVAGEAFAGIRIVIDDRDAVYPIAVDPLATSATWVVDGGQVSALLGNAVATAGDVNGDGYADIIVGAEKYDNGETDEGRAFVYLGSASGPSLTPSWTAEANQTGANMGYFVATAGDVNGDGYSDVLVGAPLYDNGETDEGRVYLYLGSATGLGAAPAWTAEGNQVSANFGDAATTAGDVNGDGYSDILVGAPYYDNGQGDEGRAYLYLGSASGPALSPAWTYESDQAGAALGFSLQTAGDVNGDGYSDVIVGAPYFDNGETDEGRAFLFLGSASGLAAAPAWTAESNQASANFGWSVATAGDVNGDGYADVVVGALLYDNGQTDEGRAYVYYGSPGGLGLVPAWTAESDQALAYFGNSVSSAGDVNGDGYADIIVGSFLYDLAVQTDVGAAFVYLGSAAGLPGLPSWTVYGPQQFDAFGGSVAGAGDVNGDGYSDVLVGAYWYDSPVQTDAGGAFLYLGGPGGPAAAAAWTAESDQASANLGFSVAGAGDVNGDGYSDVLVGIPNYDNGQTDEGRVLLYLGAASGLATSPAWAAEGDQVSAAFGFSVAAAGDVNGDGYSDIIVGAYAYDNGQTDEGRAYVYLGSAGGPGATPAWTAEGDQAGAWFGTSVATAGDVNGDGYSDVLVGAPLFDNGQTDEGRAFLYLGSAGGLAIAPAWTAEINSGGAEFGYSVSTAGDTNGDGYADVIVGAPYQNTALLLSAGGAYVFLGSAGGLAATPVWTVNGVQNFEDDGWSVSQAGDVNGDGYTDVIVGAPALDAPSQSAAGAAMVYLGSASGPSISPVWTVRGGQTAAYFGWSVAAAGDVDGDGFSDVIVGAPYFDNGQVDEGRAALFQGSAAGLDTIPSWTAESDQVSATLGFSVAGAGDVNGDGYADLVVGAPYYDNGQTDEGQARLFYGNGGRGVALRPQQRRADNTAPIVIGLRSRTPGSLRLATLGHGPMGRVPVKIDWEVKGAGKFFNGAGTQRSAAWTDSGTAGAALNEAVGGLEPGGYHWRVRMVYRTSASPFVQASRWFSVPLDGAAENDVSVSPFMGGVVWEDVNGNGIRDAGEPPLARLPVYLQTGGANVSATFTDNQGAYRFEILDTAPHRISFTLPSGYQYTLQDQGVDDTLDSDADPFTGLTAYTGPPYQAADGASWGAGMIKIGPCVAPDEPTFISGVRQSTDGHTILDFQDPNQAIAVTGYNIRRSSNAALPKSSWPILATNVVDMDSGTANKQWVDTTGTAPPQGQIWYYEVTAYNAACGAEGPF